MNIEIDDFGSLEAIQSYNAGDLRERSLMLGEVAEELRD